MRNHISDRIKANLVMGGIILAVALVCWTVAQLLG